MNQRLFFSSKHRKALAFIVFILLLLIIHLTFITAFHHHDDSHKECLLCENLILLQKNSVTTLSVQLYHIVSPVTFLFFILGEFLLFLPLTPISLKNRLDN